MAMVIKVLISVLVCLLIGAIGSILTIESIPTWYASLTKPFFNPPSWLFGPVWTVLYVLMGISFAVVWNKRPIAKARKAYSLFAAQLFLNMIWSPVFFGLKNIPLAFLIIVLMWIYVFRTIKAFAPINKTASYLLYPYLAWITFASLLNASIWFLNR